MNFGTFLFQNYLFISFVHQHLLFIYRKIRETDKEIFILHFIPCMPKIAGAEPGTHNFIRISHVRQELKYLSNSWLLSRVRISRKLTLEAERGLNPDN